jgi:hypothetical protein
MRPADIHPCLGRREPQAHRFEHRGEILAAKMVVSAGDKLLGTHTG